MGYVSISPPSPWVVYAGDGAACFAHDAQFSHAALCGTAYEIPRRWDNAGRRYVVSLAASVLAVYIFFIFYSLHCCLVLLPIFCIVLLVYIAVYSYLVRATLLPVLCGVRLLICCIGLTIFCAGACASPAARLSPLPACAAASPAVAIERGWSINLGGGMHHASSDNGMGWCAFDDIMLAVRRLRLASGGQVQKVLLVDLDAHQVRCPCVWLF